MLLKIYGYRTDDSRLVAEARQYEQFFRRTNKLYYLTESPRIRQEIKVKTSKLSQLVSECKFIVYAVLSSQHTHKTSTKNITLVNCNLITT